MIDSVTCAFDHPGEPCETFSFGIVRCVVCDSIDFALQQNNADADTTNLDGDIVPYMVGQRGIGTDSTAEPGGKIKDGAPGESLALLVPSQRQRCPQTRREETHEVLGSAKVYGWTRVWRVPFPTKSMFKILGCRVCGDRHGKKERRARF